MMVSEETLVCSVKLIEYFAYIKPLYITLSPICYNHLKASPTRRSIRIYAYDQLVYKLSLICRYRSFTRLISALRFLEQVDCVYLMKYG